MTPRNRFVPAISTAAALVGLGTWALISDPSASTGCAGDRQFCDALKAAIQQLVQSEDSVCTALGQEATRRFQDPHIWYARFDRNGNGFVRIDEPAHNHPEAPAVDGVNYVIVGRRLPGRIARHEAYGLRRPDSVEVMDRCS